MLFQQQVGPLGYTQMHACTHTYIHTHTHKHMHIHTYVLKYAHARTHTYMHAHTLTQDMHARRNVLPYQFLDVFIAWLNCIPVITSMLHAASSAHVVAQLADTFHG